MPLTALPTTSLNNAVPFVRPVPIPPTSLPARLGSIGAFTGILSGALLINDLVGKAGGYQWRDDLLAKIGNAPIPQGQSAPPPFTGGQSDGVAYRVQGTARQYYDPPIFYFGVRSFLDQEFSYTKTGAISDISIVYRLDSSGRKDGYYIRIVDKNGTINHDAGLYNPIMVNAEFLSLSITRVDGLPDTGGNIQTAPPPTVPSGYTPTSDPFTTGNGTDRRPQTDNRNRVGSPVGTLNPINISNTAISGSSNAAINTAGDSIASSPVSLKPPTTPISSPTFTPVQNPSKTPVPVPVPDRSDEQNKKVPPFDIRDTVPPDVTQQLTGLAAFLGLIQSNLNQINSNTSPDALKNAAKTGSCESLQSPSCTQGLEDRIKNPLDAKLDAAQIARDANAATQSGFLVSIVAKIDSLRALSDRVASAAKLDKIYNFLTFITVVHNASMLSSSISSTLMDALSLGLATFNIKDENDSPIDIQSIINKSVEDTVKGIVGVQNYTTLSDRWKQAVRVYQASTNMLYQVRSLWDSARSLNELTGANVGQLMNALRKDGVVSENAYPAKSESPQMVNSFMTRLNNLEEAASALQGITSETNNVVETVAQLNKDRQDFDKLIKESPKKTGVENDAAKAKLDAEKTVSVSPTIANTDLTKPES